MMVMMMLKMIVIVIIIIFIYLFILFHWFIGKVIKQLQQRVYDTLTEKLGQPALTASFNSNDQTQQLEQMQQLNNSWSLDDVLDIILDST